MSPRANPRPLTGLRVLVGRARHQSGTLSSALEKLGADVVEIPFIEIRKPRSFQLFDQALRNVSEYDWLILTSVNGVHALAARMKRLRISSSSLRHLQIAAIGPATREAIEELGLKVAIVPEKYIAESIVKSLRGKVSGKSVLLARAKVARDVIPRELRKMGARVDVVEAYETVLPEKSRQRISALVENPKRRPNIITFTSSSTVRNFVELLGGSARVSAVLDGIRLASIGPVTSATLREFGLRVDIAAKEYTIPGLVRAIARKPAMRTK